MLNMNITVLPTQLKSYVKHYQISHLNSFPLSGSLAGIPTSHIRRKISQDGLFIIPNYLSTADVNSLRLSLLNAFQTSSHLVTEDCDQRIYGLDSLIDLPAAINPSELNLLASSVYSENSRCAFSLAGILRHDASLTHEASSGGGWHRDSFLPQFKSMIYLSDVHSGNGEFHYITGSHTLSSKIHLSHALQHSLYQDRFSASEIEDHFLSKSSARLVKCCAPAGTLIIFDSSAIHRGSPISSGSRISITNYYYPASRTDQDLREHFPLP